MSILSVFFIAVGLAMDACAVSVSNGIALKKVRRKDALKMALFFGLFQFFMPLVGYFLGSTVRQYIEAYDHWVAFILLALIGLNMIKEARSEKEEEQRGSIVLSAKLLTLQAIATSIDALAVGVSFAMLKMNVWSASMVIGVVCFGLSLFGSSMGQRVGTVLEEKAQIVGGIVLIVIGTRILLESLLGL